MMAHFIAQMVSNLEYGDLEKGLPFYFCRDSSISVLYDLKLQLKCYK